MSRLIKIAAFVSILLIVLAPSCGDEEAGIREEAQILANTKKEIRQEFGSEYLSEASLFSYENRAKQIIKDVYDYLAIVTDTSQPEIFRKKAAEMIIKSFIEKPVVLGLLLHESDSQEPLAVDLFLNTLQNNQTTPIDLSADSILVVKPLQRKGNSTYAGKLSYILNSFNEDQLARTTKTSDIILTRETKIFGSDSLKVWKVRLGNIR